MVGPLDACDTGFHMASLWEITDLGTLSYDFGNPGAETDFDSRQGPPTGKVGWIRTGNYGYTTTSSLSEGRANCFEWTGILGPPVSNGTVMKLPENWRNPADGGNYARVWGTPWAAKTEWCDTFQSVWCVEDYPGSAGG